MNAGINCIYTFFKVYKKVDEMVVFVILFVLSFVLFPSEGTT